MPTLQMLDVTIGMILIFLLLSLICTALNEIIEGLLKNRGKDLEKGIRELLHDPSKVEALYKNPLIAGLYRGDYKPKGQNLPSYIPSSTFALAILDNVLPSSEADGGTTKPLDSLKEKLSSPNPSNLDKALLTLINAAGDDIDKARKNIEDWYDSSMDRVSGWYKRRIQFILIGLGLIVSVAMNVDTIAVFKSLVNDPPLRNSLVSAAQEYAKTNANDTSSAEDRVKKNATLLKDLRLPIGWDWDGPEDNLTNKELAMPTTSMGKFLKVVGWLITALAISLGSSFWFDTLNRLMVIRSTVKPKEKSEEEASEDRQNPKLTIVTK